MADMCEENSFIFHNNNSSNENVYARAIALSGKRIAKRTVCPKGRISFLSNRHGIQ